MFDAWLLMARGDVSMVDARDAMIAADEIRFGGANQGAAVERVRSRGLGEDASSDGVNDGDPKPGFASPDATEGTVAFAPRDEERRPVAEAQLFVGHYEARVDAGRGLRSAATALGRRGARSSPAATSC